MGAGLSIARLWRELGKCGARGTLSRACALTEDGRVVCWGDAEYEEIPVFSMYGYNCFP